MSTTDIKFKSSAGTFNVDQAQGIVECFVAGIGNKDSVGDVLIPGAFKDSLKRRKPRVVWGHNWNDPIGKVLEIYEVPPSDPRLPMKMKAAGIGGLYARVQFNLGSEKGKEAFANVAFFGEEQEWSIGYKTINGQFDPNLQANILKEVELYEVSPVLHGANQLTGTISVKDGESDDRRISEPNSAVPNVKPRIPSLPENPMMMAIRRELAMRSGSNVIVRSLDSQMVVFDRITSDGVVSMYRCPYHFDGESFMFGKPEKISDTDLPMTATAPAIPPAMEQLLPQTAVYGNSGMNDITSNMGKSSDAEMFSFFLEDIEEKIGKAISGRNMSKLKNVVQMLQDIIVASEKEVEEKSSYIIEVEPQNAFYTKSLLDPIMDYHRVESIVSEKGIVITSGLTPEFVDAVETLKKGLGARIGGGGGSAAGKGRKVGRALTGTFDPNAIDADGDKIVQEGTAFERPATPRAVRDAKKIEHGLRSGNGKPGDYSEWTSRIYKGRKKYSVDELEKHVAETFSNAKTDKEIGRAVYDLNYDILNTVGSTVKDHDGTPEDVARWEKEALAITKKIESTQKFDGWASQQIRDIAEADGPRKPYSAHGEFETGGLRSTGDSGDKSGEWLMNMSSPEEIRRDPGTALRNVKNGIVDLVSEGKFHDKYGKFQKEEFDTFLDDLHSHLKSSFEKAVPDSITPEKRKELKKKHDDLVDTFIAALDDVVRKPHRGSTYSLDKSPKDIGARAKSNIRDKDIAAGEIESLLKDISNGDKLLQESKYYENNHMEGIFQGLTYAIEHDPTIDANDLVKQVTDAFDKAAKDSNTSDEGKKYLEKMRKEWDAAIIDAEELAGGYGPGGIVKQLQYRAEDSDRHPLNVASSATLTRGLASAGREDSEYARELKKQREKDKARGANATNPVGKIEKDTTEEGLKSTRRGEGTILGRSGQIQRDENGKVNSPDAANMRKDHDARIFSKLRELGFNDDEIESLTGVPNGGREHPASEKVGLPSKSIRPDAGVAKYSAKMLKEKRDSLDENPSVGVGGKELDGAWADQVIGDLNDGRVDPIDLMGIMQVAMDDIHEKLGSPEKDNNAIDERQKLGKKIRRLLVNGMNDEEKATSGKFPSALKSSSGAIARPGRKLNMKLSQDEIFELTNEASLIKKHTDDVKPLDDFVKKLKEAKNGNVEITQEDYDAINNAISNAKDNSLKNGGKNKIVTSDIVSVIDEAASAEDGKFESPNWHSEKDGKRGDLGLRSQGYNGAPKDMNENEQKFLINWAYQNRGLNIANRIADKHKSNNGKLDTADWRALRTLHSRTGKRSLRSEGASTEASKLMDESVNNLEKRPEIMDTSRARGLRSEGGLGAGSLGLGDGSLNMTPTGEGERRSERSVGTARSLGEIGGKPETAGRSSTENNESPRFIGKKFEEVKPENWDSKTTDEKLDWMLYDGTPKKSGMRKVDHDKIVTELLDKQEKEDKKTERDAKRAERRASSPQDVVTEAKPPVVDGPVRVEPRPKTQEDAAVSRKKDLDALQKFAGTTADTAISANDKDNVSDMHRESWEDISSILEGKDLHKEQIKEALDRVDSYLKETADNPDETKEEEQLVARAEQLKTALAQLNKFYSKDKFIPENAESSKKTGLLSKSKVPESAANYIEARDKIPNGLRSAGRTEVKGEATWFRDIEQSMPKEITAARNAGDKKAADSLGKLQAIISRQEASKIGDRRTNAGRILITQDEADDILDGLMTALDRQVEAGGEKRQALYAELIDKLAKAAMGTFIDKTTEELNSRTRQRTSPTGRTVNIQDL